MRERGGEEEEGNRRRRKGCEEEEGKKKTEKNHQHIELSIQSKEKHPLINQRGRVIFHLLLFLL